LVGTIVQSRSKEWYHLIFKAQKDVPCHAIALIVSEHIYQMGYDLLTISE